MKYVVRFLLVIDPTTELATTFSGCDEVSIAFVVSSTDLEI